MLVPDWVPRGYWIVSFVVMISILIWVHKRSAADKPKETKKDK
ncbi:hypothetical protein [Cohnella nanjingensis]|nr:hypothetical protein [Cohnella nanjingensis]